MDPVYYPRLQAAAAQEMLVRYATLPVDELTALAAVESVNADWYATAPASSRVSEKALREFQSVVRSTASEYGYPSKSVATHPKRGEFDRALVGFIVDAAPMLPAEAAQQAVWSFMTLVVAPDVAFWRWRNTKGDFDFQRILGYPRNAYRRLWWRSYILGGGADGPATLLLEDEAVAIMERTSIAGNRRLAGVIAREHLDLHSARPGRDDILRDAMKRLRRLHAFTSFHSLTDLELKALVREALEEAASSFQDRPAKKKKRK
jgi:hypothetical protein